MHAAGARELGGSKPVLTGFMQARGIPDELRSFDLRLPAYAFPEDAASALSRVAHYAEWRARPLEPSVRLTDVRRDEATAMVAAALGRNVSWLDSGDVGAIDDRGFVVVDEPINKDTEMHPLVRWQFVGGLDLFVGNAGIWPPEGVPLSEMEDSQWERTMTQNLASMFHTGRAAARMVESGGRIVFVSSTAGQRSGQPDALFFATGKF